ALELGVPLVLFFAHGGPLLMIGLAGMFLLHAFITSNVPMGVPIEWNFMVVYGGLFLFWAHPTVTIFDLGASSGPVAAFLIFALIAIPLLGNIFPGKLSFLLAMRYYAGKDRKSACRERVECKVV